MKMKILFILLILINLNFSFSFGINNDCIFNINLNNGSDGKQCGYLNNTNCKSIEGALNSLNSYNIYGQCNNVLIQLGSGTYSTNNNLINDISKLNVSSITFSGSNNNSTIIDGTNQVNSFFSLNSTIVDKLESISFQSLIFNNWNNTNNSLFNINYQNIESNDQISISINKCQFLNINTSNIIQSISRLIDGENLKSIIQLNIQNNYFNNISTNLNPINLENTDLSIVFSQFINSILNNSFFNIKNSNFNFTNLSIIKQKQNNQQQQQQFITIQNNLNGLNQLFSNIYYGNNTLGFLNSTFINNNNNNSNNNNKLSKINIENLSFINNSFSFVGNPLFYLSSADIIMMNTNIENSGDHISGDEIIIAKNSNITILNSTILSSKPIDGYSLTITFDENTVIDNSTFCFFCLNCTFNLSSNDQKISKPIDYHCSEIGRDKRISIRFGLAVVITFIILFVIIYNAYDKFKVCNFTYLRVNKKRKSNTFKLINNDDDDDDFIDSYNENSRILNDDYLNL